MLGDEFDKSTTENNTDYLRSQIKSLSISNLYYLIENSSYTLSVSEQDYEFILDTMIDQAEKALELNEGSEHLAAYLDKIREIEEGLEYKEESYQEFLK